MWEVESCLTEVNNYPDGTLINYSELARKYNLKYCDGRIPCNAGECMKQILKSYNVDLIRLAELNRKANANEKIRVRRKKRKLNVLDQNISIPQEEDNLKVKDKVKKMIIAGKIIIGDLIVPQTFKRNILQGNVVINDEYIVEGRKVPFDYIRSSLLERHEKFLRLRKDEEYDKDV